MNDTANYKIANKPNGNIKTNGEKIAKKEYDQPSQQNKYPFQKSKSKKKTATPKELICYAGE